MLSYSCVPQREEGKKKERLECSTSSMPFAGEKRKKKKEKKRKKGKKRENGFELRAGRFLASSPRVKKKEKGEKKKKEKGKGGGKKRTKHM